jgi:hypothetical protein
MRRGNDREAAPGTLSEPALIDLITYRCVEDVRDKTLAELLGRGMRRSRLREEIIRTSAIEFSEGRCQPVSFYRQHCAHLGSSSAIRLELHQLAELGVLIIKDDPEDARVSRVAPSQRTINWCNRANEEVMRKLKKLAVTNRSS